MATEDWETTCLIYGEEGATSRANDENGHLARGTLLLSIPTKGPVFCRQMNESDNNTFRFWMMNREIEFRITFVVNDADSYQGVEIECDESSTFLSKRQQAEWLAWMETKALENLQKDQLSYTVCIFLQEHALDFFPTLYEKDDRYLIRFPNQESSCQSYPESSIVATVGVWNRENGYINFVLHDATDVMNEDQNLTPLEAKHILPLLVLWREWLPVDCQICFTRVPASDSATIMPCEHRFCRECITTYLNHKARDLIPQQQTTNIFKCPLCARNIFIVGCVKQFLEPQLMTKVRKWIKDYKNPPCHSLPVCLKRNCGGVVRRVAVDCDFVYCETCNGRWCEACLQRAPEGKEHTQCNIGTCVEFCKRYLAADEATQFKCETKFPWIIVYARSKMHDNALQEWVQQNGQVCPGCKTGVERSEGCFHIACPCGVHFCYLCGEQIFAPFYGTHHCWERQEGTFLPF